MSHHGSRHAGLTAATLLCTALAGCGASTSGEVVNLAPSAAASTTAVPLPLAAPAPKTAPGNPVLPALHAIFGQLNEETGATARGEETLLGQIGGAIKGQIEGLLQRAG